MIPDGERPPYCSLPPQSAPVKVDGLDGSRLEALIVGRLKWLNGTVLHYYFFDRETDGSVTRRGRGHPTLMSWVGGEEQRTSCARASGVEGPGHGPGVRRGDDRTEAEIRIGFQRGNGSCSRPRAHALGSGPTPHHELRLEPHTPGERSTALHEIGHVLRHGARAPEPVRGHRLGRGGGLPGVRRPAQPLAAGEDLPQHDPQVRTSRGERLRLGRDSIMEYPFRPGLILQPERYRPGSSRREGSPRSTPRSPTAGTRRSEPPSRPARPLPLGPARPEAGAQADFVIVPEATRDYTVATFGESDAVLVLFEEIDGEPRYLTGEDDGGRPDNASVSAHLLKGRRTSSACGCTPRGDRARGGHVLVTVRHGCPSGGHAPAPRGRWSLAPPPDAGAPTCKGSPWRPTHTTAAS